MAKRVCLVPQLSGVGGMVSFQGKLAAGLAARGISVCYDLQDTPYDAVLVIGGTRQVVGLRRAKKRGIRIIQRLNGMNWIHRIRWTGWRHYLRAEYGNILLAMIRSRLADRIVYQSEFSRRWWERERGSTPVPNSVVYNGVDLATYSIDGPHERSNERVRLLLVEGSLMGGYEMGLEVAVRLAEGLNAAYSRRGENLVELMVVGRVPPEVKDKWDRRSSVDLIWAGLVPSESIPKIDRSAHLLYSADVNAACPNSVIEAMACGLPVLAFDTGALPEMVRGDAGRIVAYGGDPWRLDTPDIPALVEAAEEIVIDQERFRAAARERAEDTFALDTMVDGYIEALYAP